MKFERKSFAVAALLISSLLSTFSCWASIHGTISNATTHRPIAGVELSAVSFGFSPPVLVASTVSAADGSYKLQMPVGSFPIFANVIGYADYSNFDTPASGKFDIALTPVAVISGTVFDPDSQPVPRSDVFVIDAGTGEFLTSIGTDDTGKFVLNGIDPGHYLLCVITPYDNYRDGCYGNQPIGADGIPHGTPVNVAAAQRVTGLDIHLQAGATISGTVTDRASLAPVYNYMQFMLYTPTGAPVTTAYALSDPATGAYQIVGLAPGSYYLVASSGFGSYFLFYSNVYGGGDCDSADPFGLTGCSFTGVTPLIVPPQGVSGVDFKLSFGGFVYGRVVDATTGVGIAGAQLNVCTPPNYYPTASATADASGNYVVAHVLPHFMVGTKVGDYMDQVWPHTLYDGNGWCISDDPNSLLSLPSQTGSLDGIDFALNRGAHISGTVRGTQGIAAHVVFFRSDTNGLTFIENIDANADGSFATEDLTQTGYYTALAYLDDGVTCVLYGGGPCTAGWDPSNPSVANFTFYQGFLVASGVVKLNLDFQIIFDHIFSSNFD